MCRGARVEQAQKQGNMKIQVFGVKLAFFSEHMDKTLPQYSKLYFDELIER